MPLFGLWSGGGDVPPKNPNSSAHHNGGINNNNGGASNDPLANRNPKQLFQENTQQLLLLVSRIDSASSLAQRREAAEELARAVEKKSAWSGADSITYCFNPRHINSLRQVLLEHPDEYDIVASVLEILLAATALPSGTQAWSDIAQGDQSSHRKLAKSFVLSGDQPQQRDAASSTFTNYNRSPEQQRAHAVQLISILVEDIPYLLDLIMKNRATPTPDFPEDDPNLSQTVRDKVPFWVQYNAMQLLARLHAADHVSFGRYLLQCSAVPVLLEILNDASNNGVLRDECLVLLQDITLLPANHELQTILAFDNCFDSLFTVIKEEGGIVSGSVVVRECISVMHNICRSNHAAQKLFREMGSMVQVAELLNSDVFMTKMVATGGDETSPRAKFGVEREGSNGGKSGLNHDKGVHLPPAAAETYSAVGALVSTLIRAADANGESTDIRSACVASNLPQALVRAALESLPAATNGSFETEETQLLSTLSLCVQGSKQAVEAVVNAKVRQVGIDALVDVTWLLMRMALSDSEQQRSSVAAQILTTAINAGGADIAAKILLDGLEKPSRLSGSPPLKSGYVLAALTLANKQPTSMTWHIAGHLLANCIITNPEAGLKAAMTPWNSSSSDHQQQELNFFGAYLARTRKLIEARQTDIATNIASLYPILAWMRVCPSPPEACLHQFVADPTTPMFFADWAVACRDSGSHVPLMCAVVVALGALMFPPSSSSSASSPKMSRDQLHQLVTNKITLQRLERLKSAVSSTDDWHRATRAPVLSNLPSVYVFDQTMISMMNEIMGAVLTNTSSSNDEQQQQQQQQQPEQQHNAVPEQQQVMTNNNSEQHTADPFAEQGGVGDGEKTNNEFVDNQNQQQDPFNSNNENQNQNQTDDPFGNYGRNTGTDNNDEFTNNDQQQNDFMNNNNNHDDNQPTQILQPPPQEISQTQHHRTQKQQQEEYDYTHHYQHNQQQQHQYHHQEESSNVQSAKRISELEQTLESTKQQLEQKEEKLSSQEERIHRLEKQLAETKSENQSLKEELHSVKQSNKRQLDEISRQKQDLQRRFDESYQLVQRRNEDVANAEKRAKMAEMKLQDVSKDKNELLLLVVEMEKQYKIAMANQTIQTNGVSHEQQQQQYQAEEEQMMTMTNNNHHQETTNHFRHDDVARDDYQYQQEYQQQQEQEQNDTFFQQQVNGTTNSRKASFSNAGKQQQLVHNKSRSRPDTPAEEEEDFNQEGEEEEFNVPAGNHNNNENQQQQQQEQEASPFDVANNDDENDDQSSFNIGNGGSGDVVSKQLEMMSNNDDPFAVSNTVDEQTENENENENDVDNSYQQEQSENQENQEVQYEEGNSNNNDVQYQQQQPEEYNDENNTYGDYNNDDDPFAAAENNDQGDDGQQQEQYQQQQYDDPFLATAPQGDEELSIR